MAQMAEARKPRMLDTGVPNLDLVLGGGLQWHNSYIFAGPSGVGKSVLTQQIAYYRAKQGDRVLFVTGLDEPHHNLLEHMTTLHFADTRLVGPQIETISLVPFLDQPMSEKMNVLRRTVLNARPKLVTIDGLRSYLAFAGSEEGMYQFIYGLTSWFAVEGITVIMTMDTDPTFDIELPEFSLVDGVILMQRNLVNEHSERRIWVWKMRGQQPFDGLHAFTIDADGVKVWPRPQATFRQEDRPWSGRRLAFGVPTLDPMLGDGLPEGTTTLLGGDTGAGKTVLALAYLDNGAQQGQPGLWVGFQQSRPSLMALSQQWGHDLGDAASRGLVELMMLEPFELDAHHLAGLIQDKVRELGVKRLVLDGAQVLENAFANPGEAGAFLAWLARFLPQQGVTALITSRLPRIPGQEYSVANTSLAPLVENVIIVRHVQRQGQLNRALAILKMASPGYDKTIREFTLDRYGVTLGEPLDMRQEQPGPAASTERIGGPV